MMKRFATHVMLFNCDKFILRMLDNCGPFVEKIYVAYSKEPWTHNPEARKSFKNETSLDILKESKYYSKIEIIEGVWNTDADERAACLKRANEDGFDYLLIQDADEFYTFEDFKKNLNEIENNPDYDVYEIPWIIFWKNLDYILVNRDNGTTWYTPFAVNCKRGATSLRCTTSNNDKVYKLSGLCYHLSYVLSNEEVFSKIKTWGHTAQFDNEKWYEQKWLKWNLNSKNLHPVYPRACKRAVKYNSKLPEVLEGFVAPEVIVYVDSFWDRIYKFETYIQEYLDKDFLFSILKKIGINKNKIKKYFKV